MEKEQKSIPEIWFLTGEDAINFKNQVSEAIEKNPTLSPEEFYRMKINYKTFKELKKPRKKISKFRKFIINTYITIGNLIRKIC
jgi:hypothetical protein